MTSDSQLKHEIIERYETNELLRARALASIPRAQGRDLSLGHPAMRFDPEVIEECARALGQGHTHYVREPGIEALRDALFGYFGTVGLTGYEQSNAFVTAGVQESRFLAIQAIGPLFGQIGVPEIVHPGVRKAVGVRRISIASLAVDRKRGMLPTLASIREALENGCKLLYIESPVRLTGAAFGVEAVEQIADLIAEFDATVVWDQGLAVWAKGGDYCSLGAQRHVAERVVSLGEAWPGVGLGTEFVGYLAVNEEWFESIRALKQTISICTSTGLQFIALATGDVYDSVHGAMLEELTLSWKRLQELANQLSVRAMPGITVSIVAMEFGEPNRVKAKLRDEGFWFADGDGFGASDVLRLAVSTNETSLEAMTCISEAIV